MTRAQATQHAVGLYTLSEALADPDHSTFATLAMAYEERIARGDFDAKENDDDVH